MIVQRESRQCAHRHGGDVIFAGKSALKCVLAERSYRPYRLFRGSHETMASDPDGKQSD